MSVEELRQKRLDEIYRARGDLTNYDMAMYWVERASDAVDGGVLTSYDEVQAMVAIAQVYATLILAPDR